MGGFEALVRPGMSLKFFFGKEEMFYESRINVALRNSLELHQPNKHVVIVLCHLISTIV